MKLKPLFTILLALCGMASCHSDPPIQMYNYQIQVVYNNNSVDTIRWYARDNAGFQLINHYNTSCLTTQNSLGDIAYDVRHFKIISKQIAKP